MKITDKQVVGLRVKSLRGFKDITQQELANHCGLTQVQLARIEKGLGFRSFPDDAFEKMAEFFNVDKSYLDYNSVHTDIPTNEIYILFEDDFQDFLKEAIKKYKAKNLFTK